MINDVLEDLIMDELANEIRLELDFQVIKTIYTSSGEPYWCVTRRPGCKESELDAWFMLMNISKPPNNKVEYLFASGEEATAFVLRFG